MDTTYTVLIAEDDKDIQNLLKMYLESGGYRVLTADDGESAYSLVSSEQVNLAILDVMMPRMDGFMLTKKIRESMNIPILLLTARVEDNDKILGLNLGADDYLTKPFNPLEVLARVNANLRRFYQLGGDTAEAASSVLTLGALRLDTGSLQLQKDGKEVVLTPNEYKIFRTLIQSPGRVFTKSQLCEAVNGESYENYENVIAVHVSHLRDKIEDDPQNPQYIKTVRGLGYKIEKER